MTLAEVITLGNGDCLFNAISLALRLNGVIAEADDLRQLASDHLDCSEFIPIVEKDQYIKKVLRNTK